MKCNTRLVSCAILLVHVESISFSTMTTELVWNGCEVLVSKSIDSTWANPTGKLAHVRFHMYLLCSARNVRTNKL